METEHGTVNDVRKKELFATMEAAREQLEKQELAIVESMLADRYAECAIVHCPAAV